MQGVIKSWLISIWIGFGTFFLISCGNGVNGIDPKERAFQNVNRLINDHEYLQALKTLRDNQSVLSDTNYYWFLSDISWKLAHIYEIGYAGAVDLQLKNYNFYTKSPERMDHGLLIPTLYFLAYDYYLNCQYDACAKTADLATNYLSSNHPLYSRISILRNINRNIEVKPDQLDYLFYKRIKKENIPKDDFVGVLNQSSQSVNGLKIMRKIDALVLAQRDGYYNLFPKQKMESTQVEYTYMGTSSADSLPNGFFDLEIFNLKANYFKNLYCRTVISLLNLEDSDPFIFERAIWAYVFRGEYDKALEYCNKWLAELNNLITDKSLALQKDKYEAIKDVILKKVHSKVTYDDITIAKIDYSNCQALRRAIMHNFYDYYFNRKLTTSLAQFLNRINDNKNIILTDFNELDSYQKYIHFKNVLMLSKLLIFTDMAEQAKPYLLCLGEAINNNFSIDQIEKCFGENSHAEEFFALFPYGLSNSKDELNIILSRYRSRITFPTAQELIDIISLRLRIISDDDPRPIPLSSE